MPVALQKQIELMVFGGLIIFFLIVEPHGLARLWQITQGEAAAVAVPPLTDRGEIAMTIRTLSDRAAGRWPSLAGPLAGAVLAQAKEHLHPAARLPHRALRAERHPDRQRLRRLLHARSTSATAASTASRSSWEECETQYDTKQGVECYERLKGKSPRRW